MWAIWMVGLNVLQICVYTKLSHSSIHSDGIFLSVVSPRPLHQYSPIQPDENDFGGFGAKQIFE